MSKLVKMITMALVFAVILALGISSAAFADHYEDNCPTWDDPAGIGPAPNMGDGISDGPGW